MLSTLIKRQRTLVTFTLLGAMLMLAGTAQALISYSSNINFGGVLYPGGSKQLVINISKSSSADQINVSTMMDSGDVSDFSFSGGGGSLTDMSPTTTLTVNFHPTTTGSRAAILRITANDPQDPSYSPDYYVWLSGTAGDREIEVRYNGSTVISPGDTTPSMSEGTDLGTRTYASSQSFAIHSTGGADLSISSATVTGTDAGDFSVSAGGTANAFSSTYLFVNFNPSAKAYATRTATVTINSNATAQPVYSFAIQATAGSVILVQGGGVTINDGDTTPSLTDETDFDVALISGEQVVSTYTIKNTGIGSLAVSTITKSGTHSSDFSIGGITLPATVAAGSSQTFTVTFDPSASGTRNATIAVNSDASGGPAVYDFAVKGRGTNAGDLDAGFDPDSSQIVYAVAEQPDGKLVVGGLFGNMGGVTHTRLARINTDGTVDSSFNPSVSSEVHAILVQPDGKIVIGGEFGTVNSTSRSRIARLNSDGTLDTGFTTTVSSHVHTMALQADGKILIGGEFTQVDGVTRNRIARLNTDGSLDTGFNPNASSYVRSIAVQDDGKIVVGGVFTQMGGTTHNRIARLNSDGTLDTGFTTTANDMVLAVALQGDGKIVMGGLFTGVNSTSRVRLARLNTDGTLDSGFTAGANDNVYGLSVQADGKVFTYGHFTTVGGTSRGRCARLNADGSLDTGIDPGASSYVYGVAVQEDGRIVLVGQFTSVQSTTRNRIARLDSNAATETLTKTSSSRIEWLRGGSSPEAVFVSFELSTDGGSTWSSLGNGTRISGGWEKTGLSLPGSGKIRARAATRGGKLSGSNGLVETILTF